MITTTSKTEPELPQLRFEPARIKSKLESKHLVMSPFHVIITAEKRNSNKAKEKKKS